MRTFCFPPHITLTAAEAAEYAERAENAAIDAAAWLDEMADADDETGA